MKNKTSKVTKISALTGWICKFLQEKFAKDKDLCQYRWRFVLVENQNKIIVRGSSWTLTNNDIIAEIINDPDSKDILIKMKSHGTPDDCKLLETWIREYAAYAEIHHQ